MSGGHDDHRGLCIDIDQGESIRVLRKPIRDAGSRRTLLLAEGDNAFDDPSGPTLLNVQYNHFFRRSSFGDQCALIDLSWTATFREVDAAGLKHIVDGGNVAI